MSAVPAVPAVTTSIPTMAAMVKHVQKRACEKEEQRQPGKSVNPVLAEKEEQGNSREHQEHEHRTRPCPAHVSD
jgi:hypothetical protein